MHALRADWDRLAALLLGSAGLFGFLQVVDAALALRILGGGIDIPGKHFLLFARHTRSLDAGTWYALGAAGGIGTAWALGAAFLVLRGRRLPATLLAVAWILVELVGTAYGTAPGSSAAAGLFLPAVLLGVLQLPLGEGRPAEAHLAGATTLVACSLVALWVGHQHFRFLCDDAFIAFRYVSNSQLGHGYVWNPPPFVPVEGYTSFLWVVLLDGLWTVTGADPTVLANPLSLLLTAASTVLVAVLAWRLPLTGALADQRLVVLGVVLAGTVTNRTWLAWSTSGLETALVVLLLLGWLAVGLQTRVRWGLLWGLAALLALTRPDGLLFLVGTAAAHALDLLRRRPRGADALAVLPVLLPIAHLLWRHSTYGFWLPNTYYAKHLGWWPQAGALYFTSFVLEYAVWVPLLLVPLAWWTTGYRLDRIRAVFLGTLVLHWAYYTVDVGGDHFEFRIYAHLPPLLLLSTVWALDRLLATPRPGQLAAVLALLLTLPLPWTHRWEALQKEGRPQTRMMVAEVAPRSPTALRGYARTFDLAQHWLQVRHINTRHREHAVFAERQLAAYPTREQGFALETGQNPVHAMYSVGIPAWTLPTVHILDKLGLNDRVVARSKVLAEQRTMGHDRRPPRGYVACFQPNVRLGGGKVQITARTLEDEAIRACEERFFDEVLHD